MKWFYFLIGLSLIVVNTIGLSSGQINHIWVPIVGLVLGAAYLIIAIKELKK